TGMIRFMIVLAILAGTIRLSLATIMGMGPIPSAQPLEMTAWAIRLAWRPARSGSAAVIWIKEQVHQRGTLSVWNGSLRLIRSAAVKATRSGHRILRVTRGFARNRKVVRLTRYKLLSKPKPLRES